MNKKKMVCFYFFKSFLIICSFRGRFVFDIEQKKSNFLLFFRKNELFCVDLYKKFFYEERVISILRNGFKGVSFNFSRKLNLIGIGFRCWTIFEKNKKFLIIKTSLSKDCIFYLPKTIDVYCLNSTTIFITGVKKIDIDMFLSLLKKIKKPNLYKQKGIFLENEIVKTKIGKKM
tara:strand:- start:1169 stop:1690 length:522 start_codon:yes stop_codon:yes gene_type:complete